MLPLVECHYNSGRPHQSLVVPGIPNLMQHTPPLGAQADQFAPVQEQLATRSSAVCTMGSSAHKPLDIKMSYCGATSIHCEPRLSSKMIFIAC
jgi:hypothetical protein